VVTLAQTASTAQLCPTTVNGSLTANQLIDTTTLTQLKRIHWQGTAVTTSNFALSGWGGGASSSMGPNPVDSSGSFNIVAGAGASANPTVVFTFADGTGSNDAICTTQRIDTQNDGGTFRTSAIGTPTSNTFTFVGATPTNGVTYSFSWHCDFH
jgi:hypothetical protein